MLLHEGLYLFLSVDVIGSTAYKNRPHAPRKAQHPWLKFFAGFQNEFEGFLIREEGPGETSPVEALPEHERPKLWKSLGDELVYTVQLTSYDHCSVVFGAFQWAIEAYNKSLHKDKKFPLNVKGAAWLAGFPVINAAIPPAVPSEGVSGWLDYIGPSIDTGFRLCRFASMSRIVVSVDLAYILAKDAGRAPKFILGGRESLKGVLGGRPYPIILVMLGEITSDEQLYQELEEVKPVDGQKLFSYCRDFIRSVGDPMLIAEPYVLPPGDDGTHPIDGVMPPEHKEVLEQIRQEARAGFESNRAKAKDSGGVEEAHAPEEIGQRNRTEFEGDSAGPPV